MPPAKKATATARKGARKATTRAAAVKAAHAAVEADPAPEVEAKPIAHPETVPIHVALVRAAADIGAVAKNLRNIDSGYAARSIDDVLDAVHDPLARHGIIVTFEVEKHKMKTITSRGGGAMVRVVQRVRYTFTGPEGDATSVVVYGEATDTSDKATNKALSAAFKMALIQVFTIPITGDKDDADSTTNEIGTPEPKPRVNEAAEAQAHDRGWESVKVANESYAALRERFTALPNDGTSEGFTEWRKDNPVTWPWPKTWVDAANAEIDRLTDPGPIDPKIAEALAADAAALVPGTPCDECQVAENEPHVHDCTLAAKNGWPVRPDPSDPAPDEPETGPAAEGGETPPEDPAEPEPAEEPDLDDGVDDGTGYDG